MRENPYEVFEQLFETDDETKYELAEIKDIYLTVLDKQGLFDENEGKFDTWLRELVELMQKEITNPEIPEEIDHVRIMSLHSSKGLSSKVVIVCGLIDELIPGLNKSDEEIEEQRRLFYVAITRCKADKTYPGKLVMSSFLLLDGKEALNMGIIPSSAGRPRQVQSTRFMRDFGRNAPGATSGTDLLA